MNYYRMEGEQVVGPFPIKELVGQWLRRELPADTQVCLEGTDDWGLLSEIVSHYPEMVSPRPHSLSRLLGTPTGTNQTWTGGPIADVAQDTGWTFTFGAMAFAGALGTVYFAVNGNTLVAILSAAGGLQCLFLMFISEVLANIRYLLNVLVRQGSLRMLARKKSA